MATGEAKMAIRHEGQSINAYIVLQAGAPRDEWIQVASLRTTVADMHPTVFDEFQAFATKLLVVVLEGVGATIESIKTERPPEHERAGHD